MARTIGKRNVKLVQEIAREAKDAGIANIAEVTRARLPLGLWDTWEMADQEIDRIIMDVVFEKR